MSERLNATPAADEELALLAKALAHPARVRILELLLTKDACCGEIVPLRTDGSSLLPTLTTSDWITLSIMG